MRKDNLLRIIESAVKGEVEVRRYSLPDMISESYNLCYDAPQGSNMQKLAEAHLEDLRSNPRDIERLSAQMCKLKKISSMLESRKIKDADLVEAKKRPAVKRSISNPEARVIDGDDAKGFDEMRVGAKVKFSTKGIAEIPKVGEDMRIGPVLGKCIEVKDDYVIMKVTENSPLKESKGSIKGRRLRESASEEFDSLRDANYETSRVLEEIADKLGLSSKVIEGDGATEGDYQKVLKLAKSLVTEYGVSLPLEADDGEGPFMDIMGDISRGRFYESKGSIKGRRLRESRKLSFSKFWKVFGSPNGGHLSRAEDDAVRSILDILRKVEYTGPGKFAADYPSTKAVWKDLSPEQLDKITDIWDAAFSNKTNESKDTINGRRVRESKKSPRKVSLSKRANESVKYPNGESVSDKDLNTALDYMYGTDRGDKKFTDEEKTKAVAYWLKKTDGPESVDEAKEEDIDLSEEELEELTKHLAEMRKKKGINEAADDEEEIRVAQFGVDVLVRRSTNYKEVCSIIEKSLKDAGYPVVGCQPSDESWSPQEYGLDDDYKAMMKSVKESAPYDDVPRCKNCGALLLGYKKSRKFCNAKCQEEYRSRKSIPPHQRAKKGITESKSYRGLSNFIEASSSKAFYKTFKKMNSALREGRALTRKESIDLYKASNSALTQLSIELEHNPEFLETFSESVSLLSKDVTSLLESLSRGKAPSKKTMKSLAKFSRVLLKESAAVEINPSDEDTKYIDDGTGLVAPGDIITLAMIKEYWNDNKEADWILAEYDSFDEWFADTEMNYLKDYHLNSPEDLEEAKDEDEEEDIEVEDTPEEGEEISDEEEVEPEDEEEFVGDDEGDIESEEAEAFDQEYADARVELHKEMAEKHADDEDPAIQEKIEQDKAEVLNLDGITDEQVAELTGEESTEDPEGEESDEEPTEEEAPEEEEEPTESEEEVDDADITDDELAELKKHLTEMRAAKKLKESADFSVDVDGENISVSKQDIIDNYGQKAWDQASRGIHNGHFKNDELPANWTLGQYVSGAAEKKAGDGKRAGAMKLVNKNLFPKDATEKLSKDLGKALLPPRGWKS